MKIVFMGTPEFAVPILQTLSGHHTVTAVVTQPDRPKGRGRAMLFPPVKERALALGIPVLQPPSARDAAFVAELIEMDADAFVVVAYGQILRPRVLRIPKLGCINIHASLLPKYRGAAPMQHVLLNGETVTGVTIMYMDKGIDTGDMILKKTIPVGDGERFTELHDRMAALSCECIREALDMIASGAAPREPQNHAEATYAPMLAKEDGLLRWGETSAQLFNRVRALDPWPGTYTFRAGEPLKVWACEPTPEMFCINTDAAPGTVINCGGTDGLIIKTGDGALRVTELQGQGGKRMRAADYLRGRAIPAGTVLG